MKKRSRALSVSCDNTQTLCCGVKINFVPLFLLKDLFKPHLPIKKLQINSFHDRKVSWMFIHAFNIHHKEIWNNCNFSVCHCAQGTSACQIPKFNFTKEILKLFSLSVLILPHSAWAGTPLQSGMWGFQSPTWAFLFPSHTFLCISPEKKRQSHPPK